MRHARKATATIAILALPGALAVSLADFPPQVDGLSGVCEQVYQAQISGCTGSDFTNGAKCSVGCVQGLQSFTSTVQGACGGTTLPSNAGQSVLNAFLHDDGAGSICSNGKAIMSSLSASSGSSATSAASTEAASSTAEATTTSASEATTSTEAASTSVAPVTTSSADASSTTTEEVSSTSTSVAAASTTSSSVESTTAAATSSSSEQTSTAVASSPGIALDTSSTPTASPTSTSTTSASGSTSTDDSQNDNPHSGGGSPFDATKNEQNAAASIQPRIMYLTSMSLVVGLLGSAVWQHGPQCLG